MRAVEPPWVPFVAQGDPADWELACTSSMRTSCGIVLHRGEGVGALPAAIMVSTQRVSRSGCACISVLERSFPSPVLRRSPLYFPFVP